MMIALKKKNSDRIPVFPEEIKQWESQISANKSNPDSLYSSLCVSLWVCLSLSLSVSLFECVCVSLSVSLFECVCVCVSHSSVVSQPIPLTDVHYWVPAALEKDCSSLSLSPPPTPPSLTHTYVLSLSFSLSLLQLSLPLSSPLPRHSISHTRRDGQKSNLIFI